jgi:membrane protease YdiL (CAAX protease family)
MTPAEYRLLVLILAWILVSIPLALLVWQVCFRARPVHPVIPHEDAAPAGTFLDVALPPSLPPPVELGIPVRHWKPVDGWVALGAVLVLSRLMGPLATGPGNAVDFDLSPQVLLVNLAFQLALGGLLLFYLGVGRQLNLVRIFGLNRQPLLLIPVQAFLWLVLAFILVSVATLLLTPSLLKLLGQDEASPQLMITALRQSPDSNIRMLTALTVCLGAPFMEELLFRGFFYSTAKRFMHWSYAAVGSALFFAIIHGNVLSFIPLTVLGLVFTAAYEQSKCLLVPMLMHASFNLIQISLIFYFPHLLQQLEK